MKLAERLNQFLDLFLPPQVLESRDEDARRRGRLLASFGLVAILIYSCFLALSISKSLWISTLINVSGLLCFGTALGLYRFRSQFVWASNILLFVPTAAMFIFQLKAPPFLGLNVVWAPLVPLLSTLLLGSRVGLVWTGITIVTFISPSLIQFDSTLEVLTSTQLLLNVVAVSLSCLTCHALVSINRRERDLAHRLVREKIVELDSANHQYKGLLNVVTHDIANPLTIVNTVSRVSLKDLSSSDPLHKSLNKIKKASDIVNEIITHVRSMQAIESGKRSIEVQPVELKEIFQRAHFIFDEQLRAKNLKLSVEVRDPNLKVLAEPISLSNNVFNNLISNAIKFSHPGSSIDVTVEAKEDAVEVEVRDHGIGMPEQIRKNLFRPDKKTSRAGTHGEKGTGFGMPLVKTYLNSYGADIHVLSWEKSEERPDESLHGTAFKMKFKKAA